ncbi:hypothetical protein CFIMG_003785RA [Ceratocystis fimbriata CBS 114723]|uniref:Uncharacterized protein n=1 Tax=Ceratocystis fimbriata CBS 114723 TaxID=1035309 RepID=A0A2C5WWU6_9PEZI|nr:hypothetical protein CFIMG_003785RA [Ceratocystis fimbriata CBS 114723]
MTAPQPALQQLQGEQGKQKQPAKTVQHSTASTQKAQRSTAKHSAAPHSAQHSTAQHSTAPRTIHHHAALQYQGERVPPPARIVSCIASRPAISQQQPGLQSLELRDSKAEAHFVS